jgi:hypothetical protein
VAHEPCSACGQPFFGRSVLAYPAVIRGGLRRGQRVRLCPRCSKDYIAGLEKYLTRKVNDQWLPDSEGAVCKFCGDTEPKPDVSALFVTVYPTRNDRADWGGLACSDCSGRAAQEVLVDAS